MKNEYFDVSKISLDNNGRVELNDQALAEIEKNTDIASSGAGNNIWCSGSNGGCTNSFCGGTTNSDCINSLTCGGTYNPRQCDATEVN